MIRIVALILSFLILHQSLEVCVHDIEHEDIAQSESACMETPSNDQQSHCCASKGQNQHDDDDQEKNHHHCNGDFCKCITCIKVFLTDNRVNIEITPDNVILQTDINQLVAVYSFDFNPRLIHPPRV